MNTNQNRSQHKVVVLGASNKSDRYSNMAIKLLKQNGYTVIPVHPKLDAIEELPVCHELGAVSEPIDTLTMYVGEAKSLKLMNEIKALKPRRVIFNPGSESDGVEAMLRDEGIEVIHGCTLVMLRTGVF